MRDNIEALRRDIALFRESLTKFTGLLAGRDVRVEFSGADCATDGERIVLPALEALQNVSESDLPEARRFVDTAMGLATHEVAHVLFTDFEAWRVHAWEHTNRACAMANVVEDARVEARMRGLWHGSGAHLDRYAHKLLDEERPYLVTKDAYTQICLIIGVMARGEGFETYLEAFNPELVEWCRKHLRKSIRKMTRVGDTQSALNLASRIYARVAAAFEDPPPPPGGTTKEDENSADERPAEEPEAAELDDEEAQPSQESADEAQEVGEEADEPEDGDDGAGALRHHEGAMAGTGAEALEETDTNMKMSRQFTRLTRGTSVDEFGPNYAIYTNSEDYIGPMRRDDGTHWTPWYNYFEQCGWRKKPDMAATLAYVQSLADRAVGPLRSHLGRVLKAQGTAYEIRDVEHGKLDRRRLWKVPLNTTTSARVRRTKVVGATYNLAVLIAINESFSMGMPAEWDEHGRVAQKPAGHGPMTRMDLAAAAGLALGDVLHALGVSFAIFGHTTGGYPSDLHRGQRRFGKALQIKAFTRWGDITVEYVKDFRQSWPARRKYMGGLYFQGNTYDGEVVAHATRQLLAQPQVTRRLLIMLDDGQPAPDMHQIGNLRQVHGDYLIEQVKRAEAQGVEVLGVGMACDVSRYYSRSVTVPNVEQLPQVLLTRLPHVLLGAKR